MAESNESLLLPDEPPPFTRIPGTEDGDGERLLLVCDHAANRVPKRLGDLGLPQGELDRHIGWDIGAAALTRELARQFGAAALISGYSRLVIDCNRQPGEAGSIPAVSDGTPVPGNADLDERARTARRQALFDPYHAAIEAELDRHARRGIAPAILSLHSFTPRLLAGSEIATDRPWEIGILWDRDPRLPVPLMGALAARGLAVGDNQPYSARDPEGYTLRTHADARSLPHALLEIRQDEIDTAAGVERMAVHLIAALRPILADPALYRPAHFVR